MSPFLSRLVNGRENDKKQSIEKKDDSYQGEISKHIFATRSTDLSWGRFYCIRSTVSVNDTVSCCYDEITSLEKRLLKISNPCWTSNLTVRFKSNDMSSVWFWSVDSTWALEEFLFPDQIFTWFKAWFRPERVRPRTSHLNASKNRVKNDPHT